MTTYHRQHMKDIELARRIEREKGERNKQGEEEARRQRDAERRPLEQRVAFLEDKLYKLESYVRSLNVKTKEEVEAEELKEACLRVRKSLLTDRDALFVRGPWDPPEVWVVPVPETFYLPDASTTYLCQEKGTYNLHLCVGKNADRGYVVLGVVT